MSDPQPRRIDPYPQRPSSVGERWAIVVGVSRYEHASLNLRYAHRDAQAFYELIRSPFGGGFKEQNVQVLLDEQATTRKVTRALRSFLKKPDRDDLVVLFFACHGAPDPQRPDNVYLLTHDVDPDDIAGTALPMREIDLSLRENLLADRVVIIADTCHSAAIGGGPGRRSAVNSTAAVNAYLQALSESKGGVALLTSAEASEVSLEDERWGGGHGVFTHYLLEGMRGAADTSPRNGVVTLGELFEYVRENVKNATDYRQHPSIGTTWFDRLLPMSVPGLTGRTPETVDDPAAAPALPEATTGGARKTGPDPELESFKDSLEWAGVTDEDGRVHIGYQVEKYSGMQHVAVPFVIGVLGDFSADSESKPCSLGERSFLDITLAERDVVMEHIAPNLRLVVPDRLSGDGERKKIELTFARLSDFDVAAIAARVPDLTWLVELRSLLAELSHPGGVNDLLLRGLGRDALRSKLQRVRDLDRLHLNAPPPPEDGRVEREPTPDEPPSIKANPSDVDGERDGETEPGFPPALCREVVAGEVGAVGAIDRIIAEQLDDILKSPSFQRLESAWRGLTFLLGQAESAPDVRVRILDVAKDQLRDELRTAPYDATALFKKLYEQEYGSFSGAPCGLLLGDYDFRLEDDDLELLETMARVAAALDAPFIAQAGADVVDLVTASDSERLSGPADPEQRSARWRRFRGQEESRYVVLTLPRMLLRVPYDVSALRLRGIESAQVPDLSLSYRERAAERSDFMWGNAAFGLAANLASAFDRFGWFASTTDASGDGRVANLPRYSARTDRRTPPVGPAELVLTSPQENAAREAGFAPLSSDPHLAAAGFRMVRSAHRPRPFRDARANEMSLTACELSSVLTVAQLARAMKLQARDGIGLFRDVHETEEWLNGWLRQYVVEDGGPNPRPTAVRPLLDGRVTLRGVRGVEGALDAELYVRTAYRFETTRELRLTTRLADGGWWLD